MKKLVVLLIALLTFTSCEENISYKWSKINESLGELDKARKELRDVISDLEDEGYDSSELENIDNRLKKVENILDAKFY